uniref:Uncharacterized protein n=1 Tax=Arundo donax TaxID=35708 RepID=A0A0A9GUR5_ARUDO
MFRSSEQCRRLCSVQRRLQGGSEKHRVTSIFNRTAVFICASV